MLRCKTIEFVLIKHLEEIFMSRHSKNDPFFEVGHLM